MGIFENLPYTNYHELNLDWIIQMMKKLDGEWEDYKQFFDSIRDSVSADIADEIDRLLAGAMFYPSALPSLIGEKVTWDGWHGQGFCLMDGYALVHFQDNSDPVNGKFVRFSLEDGHIIDSHNAASGHGKGNDITYDPDRNRIYVVDGNDDRIDVYNGSTFALLSSQHFTGYLIHGVSYRNNKVYAYHYGSQFVEMLEINPDTWAYKTIFTKQINAHVYQGLTYDGVFFFMLTNILEENSILLCRVSTTREITSSEIRCIILQMVTSWVKWKALTLQDPATLSCIASILTIIAMNTSALLWSLRDGIQTTESRESMFSHCMIPPAAQRLAR